MIMDSIKGLKLDVTELEVLVREDIETCLQEVTAAVNNARDGAIIDESEGPVRDALAKLRPAVYPKAIQRRVDAAEAAFSPSTPRRRGREAEKQGPSGGRP
jgi:hypothetical protein